jgi:hypothetical protein
MPSPKYMTLTLAYYKLKTFEIQQIQKETLELPLSEKQKFLGNEAAINFLLRIGLMPRERPKDSLPQIPPMEEVYSLRR